MSFNRLLLVALALSCARVLGAQPHLVKDIDPRLSPAGSSPGGFASIGNVTLFFADDGTVGNELWKTDGTTSGTTLVRDIIPGPASGVPTNRLGAAVVNDRVFFVATDEQYGSELWASDGTRDGTVMLADVFPGKSGSTPVIGASIGSTLYFTATSQSSGTELWRTNGTSSGTRMVVDLNPGPTHAAPRILGTVGSLLIFRANDGSRTGIFTTDGTAEGVQFVSPHVASFGTTFGPMVLFSVQEDVNRWSLMRTDGTSAGTTLVRTGFTTNPVSLFRAVGDVAYFIGNDGVSGSELWRTDGTLAGTRLVADVTPGSSGSQIIGFAVVADRLLFTKTGLDTQLWISDGTAEGTRMVRGVTEASFGVEFGGHYYFASADEAHGRELWRTDGTPGGTTLVVDILPGKARSIDRIFFVPRPDGLFFGANEGLAGDEPWVSDGTAAGTRRVRNIRPDPGVGSNPGFFANVAGTLFFSAQDHAGSSVWTSDGTASGTSRLDVPGLEPQAGVASGGLYYFVTGDLPALELWRTDGTVAGTFHLFTMSESRYFTALLPLRGGLFFQGSDTQYGPEPWFTDGTVAGTRLLADISPGRTGSYGYTDGTAVAGDFVYFPAFGPEGPQAWRSNGTIEGTERVMSVEAHDAQDPKAFTPVGDWVYFAASLHSSAFNLWRTHIVTRESVLVRRFEVGAPSMMWNVGGTLLFFVRGDLWRSDGTETGTTLVREGLSMPCQVDDVAVGDGILFWYLADGAEAQLWRSDGTSEATFRLGLFKGPYANALQSCLAHGFHYSAGRVYFLGNDFVHGVEPWVSDGTAAGTRMIDDINPGIASSNPGSFLTVGDRLFFSASEPPTGGELWSMPLPCDADCPSRRRSVRH